MREITTAATDRRETLVDITEPVRAAVRASGVRNGLVSVYVQDGNGDAQSIDSGLKPAYSLFANRV